MYSGIIKEKGVIVISGRVFLEHWGLKKKCLSSKDIECFTAIIWLHLSWFLYSPEGFFPSQLWLKVFSRENWGLPSFEVPGSSVSLLFHGHFQRGDELKYFMIWQVMSNCSIVAQCAWLCQFSNGFSVLNIYKMWPFRGYMSAVSPKQGTSRGPLHGRNTVTKGER